MKVAILTANLNNFDKLQSPIEQVYPSDVSDIVFHCFDDYNFPPITGLTPRLQYRIPKLFGYEMFPGYNIYIWLDASVTLIDGFGVQWLLEKLGDNDMALFQHPWRKTIREEVNHIEEYLQKGNEYITSRYKNGLHKQASKLFLEDEGFVDNSLFASTAFVYRANDCATDVLSRWWYYQSRYYTCDQIALPYAIYETPEAKITVITENVFKNKYISLVSKHT